MTGMLKPIKSFNLIQILKAVDPDHIHHKEHTADLKEPFLIRAYGSSLLFGTYSSKYAKNHTIWKQKVIFKDFIVIARDKQIPIKEAVRYAIEDLDLHVVCNCPAELYFGYKYMGTQLGYLYGLPRENRPPKRNNPGLRGSVCFAAGTKVLMADGKYQSIETIAEGDSVMSHLGVPRKVLATMQREGQVGELKVRGANTPIFVTDEHPFLSYAFSKQRCACGCGGLIGDVKHQTRSGLFSRFFKFNHHKKGVAREAGRTPMVPEWNEIGSLKPKDSLLRPELHFAPTKEVVPEFAFLLGYYLADGHISYHELQSETAFSRVLKDRTVVQPNRIVLTAGTDEAAAVGEILSARYPGVFTSVSKSNSHGKWVDFETAARPVLLQQLVNYGGIGAPSHGTEKSVSSEVFGWSDSLKWEFVKGFFLGDGCFDSRGYIILNNTNEDIARALSVVLWSLGVPHEFSCQPHHGFKIMWRVKINTQEAFIHLSKFDEVSAVKRSSVKKHDLKRTTGNYRDGYFLTSVVSYTPKSETVPVYNIEVETDNSYLVEGLAVHNCKHEDRVLRWIVEHEDEVVGRFEALYRKYDFAAELEKHEKAHPDDSKRQEEEKRRMDDEIGRKQKAAEEQVSKTEDVRVFKDLGDGEEEPVERAPEEETFTPEPEESPEDIKRREQAEWEAQRGGKPKKKGFMGNALVEAREVPEEFSRKQICLRAIKMYGLTEDPSEALFVLPDGGMLDGSDKRDGGWPGQRTQDHHTAEQLVPGSGKSASRHASLMKFLRLSGCLRVDFGTGTVDSVGVPNFRQIHTIDDAGLDNLFLTVRTLDGSIVVEYEMQSPTYSKLKDFYNDPVGYSKRGDEFIDEAKQHDLFDEKEAPVEQLYVLMNPPKDLGGPVFWLTPDKAMADRFSDGESRVIDIPLPGLPGSYATHATVDRRVALSTVHLVYAEFPGVEWVILPRLLIDGRFVKMYISRGLPWHEDLGPEPVHSAKQRDLFDFTPEDAYTVFLVGSPPFLERTFHFFSDNGEYAASRTYGNRRKYTVTIENPYTVRYDDSEPDDAQWERILAVARAGGHDGIIIEDYIAANELVAALFIPFSLIQATTGWGFEPANESTSYENGKPAVMSAKGFMGHAITEASFLGAEPLPYRDNGWWFQSYLTTEAGRYEIRGGLPPLALGLGQLFQYLGKGAQARQLSAQVVEESGLGRDFDKVVNFSFEIVDPSGTTFRGDELSGSVEDPEVKAKAREIFATAVDFLRNKASEVTYVTVASFGKPGRLALYKRLFRDAGDFGGRLTKEFEVGGVYFALFTKAPVHQEEGATAPSESLPTDLMPKGAKPRLVGLALPTGRKKGFGRKAKKEST